jgi:hypothetical protein
VPEVGVEERLGEAGREPGAVQGEGLVAGKAEPLDVDDRLAGRQLERFGRSR